MVKLALGIQFRAEVAFDDFAGGQADLARNRKILGLK